MKIDDVEYMSQQFVLKGRETVYINAGPIESDGAPGYVIIPPDKSPGIWVINGTEVELVNNENWKIQQESSNWSVEQDREYLESKAEIRKLKEQQLNNANKRGYREISVQVENTPEQKEILQKIRKLQTEGINGDQENKSPMEEYADAIAEHRMIGELEEQLKKIQMPVRIDRREDSDDEYSQAINYHGVVPNSQWYESLEQIQMHLQSIQLRVNEEHYKTGPYKNAGVVTVYVNTVATEVNDLMIGIGNMIKKGYYINTKPTE